MLVFAVKISYIEGTNRTGSESCITSVPARRLNEVGFTDSREELCSGIRVGALKRPAVFSAVPGAVALATALAVTGGTLDL